MLLTRLYYSVKPWLPRGLRLALRRVHARRKLRRCGGRWPIDADAGAAPEGWPGWPEGKQSALVLTHDVESERGLQGVRQLAELEMQLGFRSSFNFIPEGPYAVPADLRAWLIERGFEVGVHDLSHNGKLFASREAFQPKAEKINQYLSAWNAVGFRSGFMMHELDWFHALNVEYDASTFDTDPFEPQPDGVRTVFPFFVERPGVNGDGSRGEAGCLPSVAGPRGYLELPYTLPQDSTLFLLLRQTSIEVWERKLEWLVNRGALVLLNTHPDYMAFGERVGPRQYPAALYAQLLRHFKDPSYADRLWHVLPRRVAEYCRAFRPPRARTPKRVCMLSYSFYESDKRVMRYAETLAQRGDRVEVIALSQSDNPSRGQILDGVHVSFLQRRRRDEKSKWTYLSRILRFWLTSSLVLTWRHLREPYDLVHVHNVPDFLVFAAWLPKLRGAAVILDIHDILPEFYMSKFGRGRGGLMAAMLRWVERVCARFADHVIISNHLWHRLLTARSLPAGKSSVFINYVDSELFHPQAGGAPARDRRMLIYAGGLQWHQGLDIAIRAFDLVAQRLPTLEFHIYGDGPMRQDLQSLAQSLHLNGKVRFFGSLPSRQIARVMAEADLGVVAKRADSFGNQAYSTKIMEFMASGVPVVVSSTEIDRYYFDESVVRFFESGNPKALAEAILEVLGNEPVRRGLIFHALQYAQTHSWNTRKGDYLQLVDRLVADHVRPTRRS